MEDKVSDNKKGQGLLLMHHVMHHVLFSFLWIIKKTHERQEFCELSELIEKRGDQSSCVYKLSGQKSQSLNRRLLILAQTALKKKR